MSGNNENERIKNEVRGILTNIIEEVDPKDVIDFLIERRIIDDEYKEEIMNKETTKDRCRALLDHLSKCSHDEAFIVFMDALRKHYPWLVDRINTDGENKEDINAQMKQLEKELDATKRKIHEANRRIEHLEDLEKIMNSTEGGINDVKREIEILKDENKSLKQELECLATEFRRSSFMTFKICNLGLWWLFLLIVPIVAVFVTVCLRHYNDHCRYTSIVCDCSDIKANGYTTSEVYRIYVVDQGQRYYANASCDMTTTNGSWTVFQRRKDGSVDFYRGWNEYENGFGNPSGEFWLGNNVLHLFTSKSRYRLRIDTEDFEGEKGYAEYSTFDISSSADKCRLTVSGYSGDAGDSLSSDNGHQFSTKDNDNDANSTRHCAVDERGAWWYSSSFCGHSNLNGLYLRGNYSSNGSFNGYEGIYWFDWHAQWYSLKTTEMKISSF